jgi:cis-3-alkyl-4-acyloxetan-2-one decarboxylase
MHRTPSKASFWDKFWHHRLGRPYRLHYETYGNGDRPLLLLHGLASSHRVWTPLIRLLRREWQIVAPDLLGFGDSPTPAWNQYDIEQHTKHVMALLRRFRIDRPLTIVGHSMGCLVGVHIAYLYPDKVERLLLYEPPLFADVPDYKAHQRARARYFAMFSYIATHPQLVFAADGEMRRVLRRMSSLSMRADTWVPFERSLKNTIMEQMAYDELHALIIPTEIIQGRLDFVVPRADVRKMLRANPNITFRSVNRVHGVSARASRELARLLAKGR